MSIHTFCHVCREIGEHTAEEHNVDTTVVPVQPYSRMYENLRKDLQKLVDALADQPEGIFNDPAFYNMHIIDRAVLCINQLKATSERIWQPAKGCNTFQERENKLKEQKINE